ncbi:MAG: SRPBCC domain-containing protein [Bacteroidota bacterium]
MKELMVQKKITINADASRVWEALTNPELTKKYFFGCEVFSEWKDESPIIFAADGEIMVQGKILKIIPGKFLQYTVWSAESSADDVPQSYSRVTDEIYDENGRTVLAVTQDNFGEDDGAEKRYEDSDRGWDAALLGLKLLLEGPQPQK